MTKTDTSGRAYATVEETKAGDYLEADSGFTCITAGERLLVEKNKSGELYVPCSHKGRRHYLAGQEDRGVYIGLYRAEAQS